MTVHDSDMARQARPRSKQAAITIRSDRAAELLARQTRTGRSQAEVIEAALEALPPLRSTRSREEKLARLAAIVEAGRGLQGMSMAEFDAETYDENGLPR